MVNFNEITISRPITLHEIKQKVYEIVEKFNPIKVILFGSYAHGEPSPDSDVDLLIIMECDKPSWKSAVEISQRIRHTFPMDILVRTTTELSDRLRKGDTFLKEILEEGKVLYERSGNRMD